MYNTKGGQGKFIKTYAYLLIKFMQKHIFHLSGLSLKVGSPEIKQQLTQLIFLFILETKTTW